MIRVLLTVTAIATGVLLAPAAHAQTQQQTPYKNCTAAKQDGRCDIPSTDPAYGSWLDRDGDGLGCEC
jgi:hypothetical protein